MTHRQSDTQRLLQRNKNLIRDILNRQTHEKRKTKQFLSWALSDIFAFENIKNITHATINTSRDVMYKRTKRNELKDVKIAARLMVPQTHKVNKHIKSSNFMAGKRESLPSFDSRHSNNRKSSLLLLKNSQRAKNRSQFHSNSKPKHHNKSLMHITRHRASIQKAKKLDHNRSYNAPYALEDSMDASDYHYR